MLAPAHPRGLSVFLPVSERLASQVSGFVASKKDRNVDEVIEEEEEEEGEEEAVGDGYGDDCKGDIGRLQKNIKLSLCVGRLFRPPVRLSVSSLHLLLLYLLFYYLLHYLLPSSSAPVPCLTVASPEQLETESEGRDSLFTISSAFNS